MVKTAIHAKPADERVAPWGSLRIAALPLEDCADSGYGRLFEPIAERLMGIVATAYAKCLVCCFA